MYLRRMDVPEAAAPEAAADTMYAHTCEGDALVEDQAPGGAGPQRPSAMHAHTKGACAAFGCVQSYATTHLHLLLRMRNTGLDGAC